MTFKERTYKVGRWSAPGAFLTIFILSLVTLRLKPSGGNTSLFLESPFGQAVVAALMLFSGSFYLVFHKLIAAEQSAWWIGFLSKHPVTWRLWGDRASYPLQCKAVISFGIVCVATGLFFFWMSTQTKRQGIAVEQGLESTAQIEEKAQLRRDSAQR